MIKKLFNKYKEIINYVFFGVLATIVNLVSFKIFDLILGAKLYLITNVISWIITVIFAYVTNKLWVFESKSWKKDVVIKELIGFFGARLFSLGVEELGLWVTITLCHMGQMGWQVFGLNIDGNMVAKVIMQIVVVILNYIFSKFIIFTKKESKKKETADGANAVAADKKRKNYSDIIVAIFLFVFFIAVMIVPAAYRSNGIVFAGVPALVGVISLMFKKFSFSKKGDKFCVISSAILSVLFLAMLSITSVYANSLVPLGKAIAKKGIANSSIDSIILLVVFCAGILLSVYITCMTLFNLSFVSNNDKSNSSIFFGKKVRINKYLLPIFVITLICALGGLLGYEYPDTFEIYKDVIANEYNDWHTVNYEMFMKLCVSVVPKKLVYSGVIAIQAFFWVLISNYALNSLFDTFKSEKACKYYAILSSVLLTPHFYVQFAIKDPLFSMMMFGFAVSIFNFITKEKPSKKEYVLLVVLGIGAAMFRHMADVVVLVSFVAVGIYRFFAYKKDFKNAVKIVALGLIPFVLTSFMTNIVGIKMLKAEENPSYVTYTVPIYMAVAVTDKVGKDNVDGELVDTLESIMPVEEWCSYYESNIYWADTVTRTWGSVGDRVNQFDDEFLSNILKGNFKLLASHPVEYITCLFNITSIVWEISTPLDGYEWSTSNAYNNTHVMFNGAYMVSWSTVLSTEWNPFLSTFMWRGGIWIFTALLASAIMIKKKRANEIITIVPIVIYAASLMISCPAQDPRYVLSFMEVGLFYMIAALFNKKDLPDTSPNIEENEKLNS